jgi:RNA polymerase sigma-70 factor (ECF subfamily)
MGETPIDDRELRNLMTQYQRADPTALEELVRRISPPLLRYFAWSNRSWSQARRNDAEDMLQDCWIRIHSARHTYRSSEPVMPWIYAIARHTRLDAYRKRRRLESREVLVATLPERLHQTAPETATEPDALEHLVAGLPESQREVILMLKVSGMTLEEVARATSSTIGAVKQKAHRAYATLRRALGGAGGKDRENAG